MIADDTKVYSTDGVLLDEYDGQIVLVNSTDSYDLSFNYDTYELLLDYKDSSIESKVYNPGGIEIKELDLPLIDTTIYDIKAYVVFDREQESLWYLSAIKWDGNSLEWDEARELQYTELSKIIWENVLLSIDEEATEKAQDHFLDEEHDY